VNVDGLTANIKRYKDGKTNFDDLVSPQKEESESPPVQFDIDGVTITNANIFVDDQTAPRRLELTKANLKTGRIANAKRRKFDFKGYIKNSNPKLAIEAAVKSEFSFDLDEKRYALNGLDAGVKGQAAGLTDLVFRLRGHADLQPAVNQISLDDIKLSVS